MKNKIRMHKKWAGILLVLAFICALSGCKKADRADAASVSSQKSVKDVIDVDLTTLSSTMVYGEVYNMMYEPDDYIGKTVKMEGLFSVYHDEHTDRNYYSCIIQDATACCAQGMEFVLTDAYSYPDDYPKEGDWITVTGEFDTYTENGYLYCTLRNAQLG